MPEEKQKQDGLPSYYNLPVVEYSNTNNSAANTINNSPVSLEFGQTDYKSSKYDDIKIANEDILSGEYQYIRGEKQNGLAQIGLGVGRALSKAAVEFAKTPAYLYAMGEWGLKNAQGEDFTLDKALDNAVLNQLEQLDDNIKEKIPVYQSYKSGKGGIWDNIASTSFWSSDGADGVGYLLGMMGPGYALKAANFAGKLSKLGLGVNAANNVELGTQTLVNTLVESLAESKGVADQLKAQGATPEAIADAARETFQANMGILLLPNLIMNKALLGRAGKTSELLDDFRDATGALISTPAKKSLIKESFKALGIGIASEGFLEEGGQTAVEQYEVSKGLGKTDKNFIEGVASSYIDMLGTLEGQKSVFLGSVLGGIANVAGKYKETKRKEAIQPVLSQLIEKNFEGFSVDNDIYERNEDGSIKIDEKTNKPVINETKAVEAIQNLVSETKESHSAELAALNNDKTLHDYIVHNQFTRWVIPFIEQGEVGLDILNDHLDKVKDTQHLMNEQGIAKSKETEFEDTKYIANLKQKAKQLQEVYNNTKEVISNLDVLNNINIKLEDQDYLEDYRNRLTNAIFQENSKQIFFKEKIKDLDLEQSKLDSVIFNDLPQNRIFSTIIQNEIQGIDRLLQKSIKDYEALTNKDAQEEAINDFIESKKIQEETIQEATEEANRPVEEDKTGFTEDKALLNEMLLAIHQVGNVESFDPIWEKLKDNHLLSSKDREELINFRKELVDKSNNKPPTLTELGLEDNVEEQEDITNKDNISGYGTIAADYLLTGGVGTMLSTDYLLQALSGVFTNASKSIDQIRNKYAKEISDANLSNIKDFINSKLYNKIISEIKDVINKSYKNKEEAQKILNQILEHPTGLPTKLGNEISIKLDNLHETNEIIDNNNSEDQELVSQFNSTNTTSSQNEESQSSLIKDQGEVFEVAIAGKYINARNNVIMMHIFDHLFKKVGKTKQFFFKRNELGFPLYDNTSGIDINELNSIKKGDKITMKLVNMSPELTKTYSKLEDFDGFSIGIYSNNKLIGFVQQPHSIDPDSKNKDESKDLRNKLLAYRKAVIQKLKSGEVITETITNKGNGNLYTKFNDKGFIDPINNILSDSRDKDRLNSNLIFAYAGKTGLELKQGDLTNNQYALMQRILAEYKTGFNLRPGQTFQLVRDINNSWSIIPVYSSRIDNNTAKIITDLLEEYDDLIPTGDLSKILDNYIYSSNYNDRASMFITKNKYNQIVLHTNDTDFPLVSINTNEKVKKDFIKALTYNRQNINVTNINTSKAQQELKDRNALITNVTTYQGEYFVQPYLEYSYNALEHKSDILTNTEELNNEVNQKNTEIVKESLEDKLNRLRSIKDITDDELDEDEALSKTKDVTKLDIKQFKTWLSKNLPQISLADESLLKELKTNLVDVYGMYKNMNIYLFEGSGNKTAYHEAFHGIFRNLLSLNEKEVILEEVIKKYPYPLIETLKSLQEGLNKDYTYKQLTYLYYEEKLADEFAEFSNNYNNKSFLEKLTSKIKDFFNKILSLFNIFTLNNQSKIDQLFDNINKGKLSVRKKNIINNNLEIFNRPFEVFNNEYAYSKALRKVFTPATEEHITQSIGNKFIALYQTKVSNNEATEANKIYKEIKDSFEKLADKILSDPDKYSKIITSNTIKVLSNWDKIRTETNRFLSSRGIKVTEIEKIQEDSSQLDDVELGDEEIIVMENYIDKGFGDAISVSGLSSASVRLKLFLSSIPVLNEDNSIKKDEYGLEQYYNFNSVYYFIERNLTGVYTFTDQLLEIDHLSERRPELKSVISKLGYEIIIDPNDETNRIVREIVVFNIKSEQLELLRNDFKTNFSKQQLAYTLVKFKPNKKNKTISYEIIDSNRKTIDREISELWVSNLYDPNKDTISKMQDNNEMNPYGQASELLSFWNSIKNENILSLKDLKTVLSKIGIDYSSEVIKSLTEPNILFRNDLTNYITWYTKDSRENGEYEGKKALRNLVKIETDTILNTYTSSFNDVENKNIYSIQLPSFVSKKLALIQTDKIDDFRMWINDMKKDPFYKYSNLLKEFEDGQFRKEQFKLSFLDGLKKSKGESKGSKFTNMNPRDYMSMQVALFQNTNLNSSRNKGSNLSKHIYITPSDKTMAMIFDMKQYNVALTFDKNGNGLIKNSEIIGKFYNVFLNEANRIKHAIDIKQSILAQDGIYSIDNVLEHFHVRSKNNDGSDSNSWSELQKYINRKDKFTNNELKHIESLFNGNAFNFNYFTQNFNNKHLKEITNLLENSRIEDIESTLESLKIVKNKNNEEIGILRSILNDLNKEFENTLEEMEVKGLITKEEDKYKALSIDIEKDKEHLNILQLAASFATNSLLNNIELSNLFNGDIALYKPNDLQKRTYQGQSMFTNNNWDNKVIRTKIVKDYISGSESISSLIDILKDEMNYTDEEINKLGLDDYKNKINVTDAQVYITPEFFKRIHISRGTWNSSLSEAFDIIEGNKKGNIRESLRMILGGIKPFYYGNRFDDKLGIQRYEQVKCAMIPLFKGYTTMNPLLESKRQEMIKDSIDMLAHESSFKAAIGYRTDITSSEGLILELDADNFGIQVDNPIHGMDEQNDSMRQLKMLLLGSIDKSKTYKGISGKTILESIMSMEATNIQEALIELSNKMDTKTNKDFLVFVKDMVTKRGATNNIEELLSIENGEFIYPLDNGNLSTQIENLISSIYTNNVIKQSFTGDARVQASSLGLKFNNPIKEGISSIFNEISELSKIGNQQEYSNYLNNIFPNSSIKDILYHGTPYKFDKFNKNESNQLEDNSYSFPGYHFTKNINTANQVASNKRKDISFINNLSYKELVEKHPLIVIPVLLNIQRPYLTDDKGANSEWNNLINNIKDTNDSIIYENKLESSNLEQTFIVPNEKQIHVLGSKEDIEGFKKWKQQFNLIQQELKWIRPNADSTGIEYAQCAMPAWSKHFFDEKGLLKDINNIPDSLKELIVYRIPTEGLHSMLPIKVVKFLPETMGNFILLPYEVTTQMGADFDFDKLYFINKEFYRHLGEDNKVSLNEYEYIEGEDPESINKRYFQYVKYTSDHKIAQLDRDKFEELSIEFQNVKAARNNRILNNYLTLLTSKENLHLLIKPSGFDKLKKIKREYFKDYQKDNFFSGIVQRNYKDRNHIGIALKGQSALHVSGHSYAVLMNLTTESYFPKSKKLDTTKSINFNGINKFNFSGLYTEDGTLIADELSSIMAAILDDIKEPLLAPLGINKNTIDVLAAIVRSGYNITTALKFISQSSVKELSNKLDLNGAKIKEENQGWYSVDNVIADYEEKLEKAMLDMKSEEVNNPDFQKLIDKSEQPSTDISEEQMEFNLKLQKGFKALSFLEKAKFYIFQIRVLKNFKNISTIADQLTEINKFFAINKEVGPNIENIISKQELLTEIHRSELLRGFDMEMIPTLNETWRVHQNALSWFSKYFPYSSKYYMDVKKLTYMVQSGKSLNQIPVEDRQYVNNFIRYFTDNNAGYFAGINEEYKNLFVSLPKQISDIKYSDPNIKMGNITYGQIRENLFFKSITRDFEESNPTIQYLRLKGNKLDLQVKNNILESFLALYKNKNTTNLALDLVKHSFVSTGFFGGLGSYASYINPEILKDITYMDYRREITKNVINSNIFMPLVFQHRLIDQMIRNNPKPFTKVYDQTMFGIKEGEELPEIIGTTIEQIKEAKREKDLIISNGNNEQETAVSRYIRLFTTNGEVIYKDSTAEFGIITGNNDHIVYTRVSPLGKKGSFVEVDTLTDIKESFLKENNNIEEENKNTDPINEDSSEIQKPVLESDNIEKINPEDMMKLLNEGSADLSNDQMDDINNELPNLDCE